MQLIKSHLGSTTSCRHNTDILDYHLFYLTLKTHLYTFIWSHKRCVLQSFSPAAAENNTKTVKLWVVKPKQQLCFHLIVEQIWGKLLKSHKNASRVHLHQLVWTNKPGEHKEQFHQKLALEVLKWGNNCSCLPNTNKPQWGKTKPVVLVVFKCIIWKLISEL